MRKDCSKTEVFLSEWVRMCNSATWTCNSCELHMAGMCDSDEGVTVIFKNIQDSPNKFKEVVQKWSDEHPEQTMAEKFFEMFPNAPRYGTNGIPRACPDKLGWGKNSICDQSTCNACWNRIYKEVK